MKAKYSTDPNDYKLTSNDYWRIFDLNWDNINTFDDFKKAKLLEKSKSDLKIKSFGTPDPHNLDDLFGKWIIENPDFDKYFMMCY